VRVVEGCLHTLYSQQCYSLNIPWFGPLISLDRTILRKRNKVAEACFITINYTLKCLMFVADPPWPLWPNWPVSIFRKFICFSQFLHDLFQFPCLLWWLFIQVKQPQQHIISTFEKCILAGQLKAMGIIPWPHKPWMGIQHHAFHSIVIWNVHRGFISPSTYQCKLSTISSLRMSVIPSGAKDCKRHFTSPLAFVPSGASKLKKKKPIVFLQLHHLWYR